MSEIVYSLMVRGSDGQTYYASFKDNLSWIQQRMGICDLKQRCGALEEKNRLLELRVQYLEQPGRLKRIKELLGSESQGRTERWLRFRVSGFQSSDLWQLKQDCAVHSFRKGNTELYALQEV